MRLSHAGRQLLQIPLKLVVSLAAISFVTFVATNAIPGDASRAVLGRFATEEQIATFREQQALDEPVISRYFSWVGNLLTGDFGMSVANGQSVWETIEPRLIRSLTLALLGFAIAVPVSFLIGLLAGRRTGGRADSATSFSTLVVAALPEFVIGVAILMVVGVKLGWLPVNSTTVSLVGVPVSEKAKAFILPAATIAIANAPYLIRMTRANTREIASQPYMRAAILRGLGPTSLTIRHLVPNAAPPVVNGMAILLGSLLGGVVAIEAVFAFPGLGQLMVSSVRTQDVPMVQALALIVGAGFVVVNALADLAIVILTPRLRTAAT